MSSCADVAAILSDNRKAFFIGQETGGDYQGNTSGIMGQSRMPPFDFTLTVPLQKYINHVDTSKNAGRGTRPDYPIKVSIEDILSGKDKESERAINIIKATSERLP